MKKLSWLILFVFVCARIGHAQQASTVFLDCTATPGGSNQVLLTWDTDSAAEGNYFIIERSPDETHFENISVVRVAAGMQHYEVVDAGAPNGSDFYRIKYTERTGAPVYSKTMQLSLSG